MTTIKLIWHYMKCSFYNGWYEEYDPALSRKHALAASVTEEILLGHMELTDASEQRWVGPVYVIAWIATIYYLVKEYSKEGIAYLQAYSLT